MNPTAITVNAGYCLLKLGRSDQAAAMLVESVDSTGVGYERSSLTAHSQCAVSAHEMWA
jgi:hypothetical protein